MNVDDRLGTQDVDAAALFSAARAFRPSARGRRRVLRALGLPIGLSLFGSGIAHAAYLLSSSLKGWGMVAAVVATVGAAGSVTYVVTAPSTPTRAVSTHRTRPALRTPAAVPPPRSNIAVEEGPGAAVPAPGPPETAMADVPMADAAPRIAAPLLPGVDRSLPKPVHRLSMRAEPRTLASRRPSDDGDRSPAAPSPSLREESPIEAAPLPAGIAGQDARSGDRPPAVSSPGTVPLVALALAPPPFRASSESATPQARPAAVSSSLNGELALVAEAQARLRSGDAPGALVALDRHQRQYPAGALAEEIDLLRVRAFIAKGDPRSALETGENFLRRHPASPLGARFRSLMKALDGPAIP